MNLEKKARESYARVTSVLYPFTGLASIDQKIVQNAAERGTRVHKICEGIVSGLGEWDVDEKVSGYVESFKKWWSAGVDVNEMEKRFWDDELCITGQVDFITSLPDGLAVVDLKTSYKPSKTWQVQGSAYAYLAKKAGYNIQHIQFIHLSKTGSAPKIYTYPVDDNLFLSVLTTYNHFYKKAENVRGRKTKEIRSVESQ